MRAMLSRMDGGEGFVAAWGKSNLRNGFNSYDYFSRNISKNFFGEVSARDYRARVRCYWTAPA
jgi:hypothetical protein